MPSLLIPPRFGGDAWHLLGHAWHLPELGCWQATLWYTPDQRLLQEAKEGEAALTGSTALNMWLYRAVTARSVASQGKDPSSELNVLLCITQVLVNVCCAPLKGWILC